MKKLAPTLALVSSFFPLCQAAITFTGSEINETFAGYDGTAGPAGWDADGFSSGAGFSENRGSSTGGVGTGGAYAFDIGSGNVALGVQPGGDDFTPGFYQLEVVNNSGVAVTAWNLSFAAYYYNDQPRGNDFGFSYSTDGTGFTVVPAAQFTSPEAADGSPAWIQGVSWSDTIGAPVADGASLYLRWTGTDNSGGGFRDEFALDDVKVNGIPEPTSALLGALGLLGILRRRR